MITLIKKRISGTSLNDGMNGAQYFFDKVK